MSGRRVGVFVGMVLLVMAAGWLTGCGDDSPTSCPTFAVGAVEGRLTSGGTGVSAVVGARALEGRLRGQVVVAAQTDSSGWYRLELPSGLYRIEEDPGGGIRISNDFRDTVTVASGISRLDLARGLVRLHVDMPARLDGSRVTVRLDGASWDSYQETGEVVNGAMDLEFPLVQPGSYDLELLGSLDLNLLSMTLLSTTFGSGSDPVEVSPLEPCELSYDLSQSLSRLSGHLSGSWLEDPDSSPRVEVYDQDHHRLGQTRCDEDGAFEFFALGPVEARVGVDDNWMMRWFGGDDFESATALSLNPGADIGAIDLVSSGMMVTLNGPGDLVSYQMIISILDEAGNELFADNISRPPTFGLHNFDPGRYYLFLDGRPQNEIWQPVYSGGASTLEGAQPIDLAEGELENLTFDLVEGGRIAGQVLLADGTTPHHALVVLLDASGQPTTHEVYWSAGQFNFRGLIDGSYTLGVEMGGNTIWWYPGTAVQEESTPLLIQDHGRLEDLILPLPATVEGARS